MTDLRKQLRTYLQNTPEITLDEIRQERLGKGDVRPIRPRTPAPRTLRAQGRPAWVAAVAAFAGALVLGGVIWLLGAGRDSAPVVDRPEQDPTSTTALPTTTAASVVTIMPAGWDPILADTRARPAPLAAACPPGTDPGRPGPSDQQRPETITHSGLSAAFDRHAGRIVYVDAAGSTWTFDVCASTWQKMNPTGTPYGSEADLFDASGEPSGVIGDMVYDIDSDRTVVFSGDTVYAYDANTNTWTAGRNGYSTVPDDFTPYSRYPLGAVYDPVSGLIITTSMVADDGWELWAYDVDTGTWTPVGTIALDRNTPCCTQIDLLGYSQQLDRLILTTYGDDLAESPFKHEIEELTLLLDPRTGTMEVVSTPSPVVDLVWPGHSYGQADGTVFVNRWIPSSDFPQWGQICGFDPASLEWTRCLETPPGRQARDYYGYAAMVDDPINQRLVLINGYRDGWPETDAAVWAVDLSSGDTLTLVPPPDRTSTTVPVPAITWSHEAPFGIELSLNPAIVPPVPGRYEIEIDVDHYEAWTKVWACPALHGVVEPETGEDAPVMEELCVPLEPLQGESFFPRTISIDVTDAMIDDGGVVIAVNAAWGSWAGTAFLWIGNSAAPPG